MGYSFYTHRPGRGCSSHQVVKKMAKIRRCGKRNFVLENQPSVRPPDTIPWLAARGTVGLIGELRSRSGKLFMR